MPLLSFLLYIFVTSFTPGPNNIMAMVLAHKYGLRKTIRFCLGVCAGFFIIMLLCSAFHLILKNLIPKVEFAMTIFGSLYMLYLAIQIITSQYHDQEDHKQFNHGFFTGMCLQFINPKGILYGLTAISTFILPYHSSIVSLLFFSSILALVGFLSTFCWSMFGSLFKKFLLKYNKPFHFVMALLLMYSALSILIK